VGRSAPTPAAWSARAAAEQEAAGRLVAGRRRAAGSTQRRRPLFSHSASVAHANDEAGLEGLLVDASVQQCVLELRRSVGIDEDTSATVLDYDVALDRPVHDGVVPAAGPAS